MKQLLTILTVLFTAVSCCFAEETNLICNGGFEEPGGPRFQAVTNELGTNLYVGEWGSGGITAWTRTGSRVWYAAANKISYPEGHHAVVLDAATEIEGVNKLQQGGIILKAGVGYPFSFSLWGQGSSALVSVRLVSPEETIEICDKYASVPNDGKAERVEKMVQPKYDGVYTLEFSAQGAANSTDHVWIDDVRLMGEKIDWRVARGLHSIEDISHHDVVYENAGTNHLAAMPTGNGDIGVNVWTENKRDIVLLIAKNDAWEENSILCKVGKIRITLPGDVPFTEDVKFSQTLKLKTSEILIHTSEDQLRIRVDANSPVIRVEATSLVPKAITVAMESWRKTVRPVNWETTVGEIFKNLSGPDPYPTIMYPDTVADEKDAIVWYHSNRPTENDGFAINMKLQGLADTAAKMKHPLNGRTFGAWVWGDNLNSVDNLTLKSGVPGTKHSINICSLTEYPATGGEWLKAAAKKVRELAAKEPAVERKAHNSWWSGFWDRSHIFIKDASGESEHLSQFYNLQRYLNACGSRGEFPVKFNGGMWTFVPVDGKDGQDFDYRLWGNGYWFQNTRLIHYSMYETGDFDLMRSFFDLYKKALPMARDRTRKYYKHDGAHFPETIFFWGASVSGHYGWTPFEKRSNPADECTYTTYYWQGMIENTLMMHDYHAHTQDDAFARDILLPFAEEMTLFYDQHYERKDGKLQFTPSQSLETYQAQSAVVNPLPEIAGLRYLLPKLIALPETLTSPKQRERWHRLLGELPEIPLREANGQSILSPAESYAEKRMNIENPELYAVHPYKLFGVGEDTDINQAIGAAQHRQVKINNCWHQGEIQLANLGLRQEAKEGLLTRAGFRHPGALFPAFGEGFHDWVPCQDHGCNVMNGLHAMLMRCSGRKIILLPAWPKEWDASFKLHAPYQTIIEGKVENGKVDVIKVTPESRRKDIVIQPW